ncbi:MAG: GumC family protein [Desulfobacterales bacterium]
MEKSEPIALKISLRDVLFIVFSKIHVLIGVFCTIVILTVGYALLARPVYEVSADVLLKPFIDSRQQIYSDNRFAVAPVSQEDVNTEIKILTSRELVLDVAEKLGMGKKEGPEKHRSLPVRWGISFNSSPLDDAITYIRQGLDISPVTMSNVIRISKKGGDPQMIAKIVNTFLDCYVDRHIEVYKSGSGVGFYDRQIQLHAQKLDEAEKELKDFEEKWDIVDIENQNIYNIKLLQILRERQSAVRSDLAEKRQKHLHLAQSMTADGELSAMSQEFRENQLLVQLVKAYVPLLVEKERIISFYPPDSPEYNDIVRQTDRFRDEIRREQKKIRQGLNLDLAALEKQQESLEEYIQEIEAESRFLADKKLARENLAMKVEQSMYNYKLYMNRLEEARISEQRDLSGVANVSIVSRAHVPSIPVYPKKKFMMVIAVIAGAIAGTGSAFAAYYLDHTVKKPEDLVRLAHAPVLSTLENIEPRS